MGGLQMLAMFKVDGFEKISADWLDCLEGVLAISSLLVYYE
jgi:hypothetical protein